MQQFASATLEARPEFRLPFADSHAGPLGTPTDEGMEQAIAWRRSGAAAALPDLECVRSLKPGDKVVDFGIGTGWSLPEIGKVVGGANVYGVDARREVIDILRQDPSLASFRLQTGFRLAHLPEGLARIAHIRADRTFPYMRPDDIRLFFSEAQGLLKRGGTLFVSFHHTARGPEKGAGKAYGVELILGCVPAGLRLDRLEALAQPEDGAAPAGTMPLDIDEPCSAEGRRALDQRLSAQAKADKALLTVNAHFKRI